MSQQFFLLAILIIGMATIITLELIEIKRVKAKRDMYLQMMYTSLNIRRS